MGTQAATAASLDAILHQITTSNNTVTLNQTIRTALPKESREMILAGPLASGQDPLSILDIQVNTLGVLYILSARLGATLLPLPTLDYVQDFCRHFDVEQAQIAPDRVTILAKGIVRLAETTGSLKHAIQPLFVLLTRFAVTPSRLTTVHPIFVTICLQTQHLTAALPILAHPISQLGQDLIYNDNLVFHYVGGMILATMKRWREAEEWFEICVSAPAQQPAALQMEALKKLICVQLISKGKTSPLPKYTNAQLMRLLSPTPYIAFVNSYPQQIENLRTILDRERQLFVNDRTFGLLRQAVDRAPRWQIKKLTRTYLTLGLAEIGKAVRITDEDQVRAVILSMIESSEISAHISASGIVTFSDVTPQFSNADVERVLREAEEQAALLKSLEDDVGRSKEYLSKAIKAKEDSWVGHLPDEEAIFAPGGIGAWADDAVFA